MVVKNFAQIYADTNGGKNAEGNREYLKTNVCENCSKKFKSYDNKDKNTVVMSATLTINLKSRNKNSSMTSEQFESEKEYQSQMSIMRTMLIRD